MELTEVPGRTFLDTSVVNFVLDYGGQIHDGAEMPAGVSDRVAADIDAFRGIFLTGKRASWQLVVSPFTYAEVTKTQNLGRAFYLENWLFEIWHYWQNTIATSSDLPSLDQAERVRVNLLASGALDALPDLEDRILLCDAIAYRCDVFCTRDWRSILRHRADLHELPIKIATPREWWSTVLPFAALWA